MEPDPTTGRVGNEDKTHGGCWCNHQGRPYEAYEGEIEPKGFEHKKITEIFNKYGIKDIWGINHGTQQKMQICVAYVTVPDMDHALARILIDTLTAKGRNHYEEGEEIDKETYDNLPPDKR